MPGSEKSRRIMESFKQRRIQRRQGYSSRANALRAREDFLREQAYPEPGAIHSQFQDIGEFDPEAAERLTSKEQAIRRGPYEAVVGARREAESEEERALSEQEAFSEEFKAKRAAQETKQEKERVAGVKSRASQEIMRQQHPDWGEDRIRLELRKRNELRFYVPPEKRTTTGGKGFGTRALDFLSELFG